MYITSRQRVDEMMVMPYVRDEEGDEWILLSSAVEDRTTSNKGSRASRRDCSISSLHHGTLLDDGKGLFRRTLHAFDRSRANIDPRSRWGWTGDDIGRKRPLWGELRHSPSSALPPCRARR